MIWLSAQDIADAAQAGLMPGLPTSERAVRRLAARLGWAESGKARPRAGRGGGLEYHVDLLPPAARLRWLGSQTQFDSADLRPELRDGPVNTTADARQVLVRLASRLRDQAGLTQSAADALLCEMVGGGAVDLPAWITAEIKTVSTRSLARKLCEAILEDLGIPPRRTIADMVDQISEELARSGRPLPIDEADHLVSRAMIEIVRDIYESSGAAVILIGEEQLPKKLMQWERVHGRMLDWVGAEPGVVQDVAHLAPIYCPGVELDEPFKARLLEASNNSIRRVCINLARVLEVARTEGMTAVSREAWGNRGFFSGQAPTPRRL